jgi:hypothetical protein
MSSLALAMHTAHAAAQDRVMASVAIDEVNAQGAI